MQYFGRHIDTFFSCSKTSPPLFCVRENDNSREIQTLLGCYDCKTSTPERDNTQRTPTGKAKVRKGRKLSCDLLYFLLEGQNIRVTRAQLLGSSGNKDRGAIILENETKVFAEVGRPWGSLVAFVQKMPQKKKKNQGSSLGRSSARQWQDFFRVQLFHRSNSPVLQKRTFFGLNYRKYAHSS